MERTGKSKYALKKEARGNETMERKKERLLGADNRRSGEPERRQALLASFRLKLTEQERRIEAAAIKLRNVEAYKADMERLAEKTRATIKRLEASL